MAKGAKVLVEKRAGKGSCLHNGRYDAARAEIVGSVADLFAKADIILKVEEPIFNEAIGRHIAYAATSG